MSLQPITCKVCNETIREPEIIIGEDKGIREAKVLQEILVHFNSRMQIEAQKIHRSKPHLEAYATQIQPCVSTSATFITLAAFDLPEWIDAIRLRLGRTIHEGTRQVRITDEHLEALYDPIKQFDTSFDRSVLETLKDMRDRYEGLGKYAPAAPAQPELVKP